MEVNPSKTNNSKIHEPFVFCNAFVLILRVVVISTQFRLRPLSWQSNLVAETIVPNSGPSFQEDFEDALSNLVIVQKANFLLELDIGGHSVKDWLKEK